MKQKQSVTITITFITDASPTAIRAVGEDMYYQTESLEDDGATLEKPNLNVKMIKIDTIPTPSTPVQ
jgi:hypothetical protein